MAPSSLDSQNRGFSQSRSRGSPTLSSSEGGSPDAASQYEGSHHISASPKLRALHTKSTASFASPAAQKVISPRSAHGWRPSGLTIDVSEEPHEDMPRRFGCFGALWRRKSSFSAPSPTQSNKPFHSPRVRSAPTAGWNPLLRPKTPASAHKGADSRHGPAGDRTAAPPSPMERRFRLSSDSNGTGRPTRWTDHSNAFKLFKYKDLEVATARFSEKNLLGSGGFGLVYKGVLEDGTEVAVKKLAKDSHQGVKEFQTEIKFISEVRNINIVKLVGACQKNSDWLVVYEYLANCSLDKWLHPKDDRPALTWRQRHRIATCAAQGLMHIHKYASKDAIVHRDVKPQNILLDSEFNAKIADFGLARTISQGKFETISEAKGTRGYIAPEYAYTWQLTTAADVYSYGICLLELVSGQKAICAPNEKKEGEPLHVREVAQQCILKNQFEAFVDPRIELFDGELEEARRVVEVALECVLEKPNSRPRMEDVWVVLSNRNAQLPPLSARGMQMLPEEGSHERSQTLVTSSQRKMVLDALRMHNWQFVATIQESRGQDRGACDVMVVESEGIEFCCKRRPSKRSTAKAVWENEVACLKRVSKKPHPNVLVYYGKEMDLSDDGSMEYRIFTEYVGTDSLAKRVPLDELDVRHFTQDLLRGLQSVHANGVVHLGIRCSHLFVHLQDGVESLKLGSFSMASIIGEDKDTCPPIKLTSAHLWAAPEVSTLKPFGRKADIWSVGITVIEMLTGQDPYTQQQSLIGGGDPMDLLVPKSLSKDARDFVSKCLERKPQARATLDELLAHPFANP